MFQRLAAFMAAVVLVACSPGRPSISIQSPTEGQTFKIGDNVTIAWRCHDCEGVFTRKVSISLWPIGGGQIPFSHDISEDLLSGSIVWRAGTVKGGKASPGVYKVIIHSRCDDGYDRGECVAHSGTFKLTD